MNLAKQKAEPIDIDPARALQLLERHAKAEQDALASRTDVGEDVLDYLAKNGAPATRRAVAANPAASYESNRLLADDDEDDVRAELARKIGRLFPGMLKAEKRHLRDLVIETLERLARDEDARVRAILAEEIRELDCVPHRIVKRLAQDIKSTVSTPIIEFSPLLSDADLIEIVAAAQSNAVFCAIARRKGLGEPVSDAVVATRDTSAITTLLRNVDAMIRKKTLDRIVSDASEVAEWHGPLVLRTELSTGAIKRLASFVAATLIDALSKRAELDHSTRAHLAKKMRERAAKESGPASDGVVDLKAALKAGQLDEGFVTGAIEACRKDTVIQALALLAKVEETVVRRILESGSAKPATALAWRAGLGMRAAFKLQTQVMKLKGSQLLPARGGVDFPMSEDEMRQHLGVFGIG